MVIYDLTGLCNFSTYWFLIFQDEVEGAFGQDMVIKIEKQLTNAKELQ
jgi:hypothetical protein